MISERKIQEHIDALAEVGNLGSRREDGYLRAAWSAEETRAFDCVRRYADAYGFSAEYDAVGN